MPVPRPQPYNPEWKAVTLNYDFVQGQGEDYALYCLSRQQVAMLQTLLGTASWKTRWYSNEGTEIDTDWLDAFVSETEANLMIDNCGVATQVQEIFNLVSQLALQVQEISDMSCLQAQQSLAYYQAQLLANGDPIGAPQPSFVHDNGDLSDTQTYARDKALCDAIHRYIYTIVQQQMLAGGLAVGAIAAALSVFGTPILGAVASTLGGVLLADLSLAVGDSEAVDNVACCMYKGLNGNMSQDLFTHSLDDCGFSFPSNEATIAGAVGANNGFGINYRAFQSILGEEYNEAMATAPTGFSDCTDCLECEGDIDFRIGKVARTVIRAGTLAAGVGLKGTKITNGYTGQQSDNFDVEVLIPDGCAMANVYIQCFRGTAYVGGGSDAKLEIFSGTPGSYTSQGSWTDGLSAGANNFSHAVSGSPPPITRMVYKPVLVGGESDLRAPFTVYCLGWD